MTVARYQVLRRRSRAWHSCGAGRVRRSARCRSLRVSTLKLRIQGNSIRLRLSRSEVGLVQRQGRIGAAVCFPGGATFEYFLETSAASDRVEARLAGACLTVSLPEAAVRQWASTEQVSIAAEQPLGQNDKLSILVEKDFACLKPREDEDESDMFPHPGEDPEL
jgi:hypothetical protein